MKNILILSVIALIMTSGCVQNGETPPVEALENSVEIVNFAYKPQEIIIGIGDTITWTNRDSVGHTATSDTGNEIDSPLLLQGGVLFKNVRECWHIRLPLHATSLYERQSNS